MFNNKLLLLSLLLLAVSLGIFGCNNDDPEEIPAPNNPAKALETKAITLAGYLDAGPTREIREEFFSVRNSEPLFSEPGSAESQDVLRSIIDNTRGRIWSAGLIDIDGTVLSVYPSSRDSIVGLSWADRQGVASAMDATGFHSDDTEKLENSMVSLNYYYSLSSSTDPERIIFASVDVDSIVSQYAFFLRDDVDHDYSYFILEPDGRVIYDFGAEYFDVNLTDGDTFSSDIVTLAERMLLPAESAKYDEYNFDNAPGANSVAGDRYIGWSYSPLLSSTYWIVAVTESIE